MAKKLRLGTLIVALAFGMTLVGCAGEGCVLNGDWVYGITEYRFRDGVWEMWADGIPETRGTYTAARGSITMTTTHAYDDGAWLNRGEVRALVVAELGMDEMRHEDFEWMGDIFDEALEAMFAGMDETLDGLFAPRTGTYYVSGDTLILTIDGEAITLAR